MKKFGSFPSLIGPTASKHIPAYVLHLFSRRSVTPPFVLLSPAGPRTRSTHLAGLSMGSCSSDSPKTPSDALTRFTPSLKLQLSAGGASSLPSESHLSLHPCLFLIPPMISHTVPQPRIHTPIIQHADTALTHPREVDAYTNHPRQSVD